MHVYSRRADAFADHAGEGLLYLVRYRCLYPTPGVLRASAVLLL